MARGPQCHFSKLVAVGHHDGNGIGMACSWEQKPSQSGSACGVRREAAQAVLVGLQLAATAGRGGSGNQVCENSVHGVHGNGLHGVGEVEQAHEHVAFCPADQGQDVPVVGVPSGNRGLGVNGLERTKYTRMCFITLLMQIRQHSGIKFKKFVIYLQRIHFIFVQNIQESGTEALFAPRQFIPYVTVRPAPCRPIRCRPGHTLQQEKLPMISAKAKSWGAMSN